jgi:hypothetical protein
MAASLTKTQSYVASQWETQTSGNALTVTLVEDDYLWIRQTLTTTDDSVTPTLTEMTVEVVEPTGYDLTLESGSYTLTGSAVSFKHTYNLSLGSGTHSITGSDVTLTADRTLALAGGSYAITGTAVGFKHTYNLTLGGGSYTVTGSDLAFDLTRLLSLGSGEYTVTGSDITLFAGTKTLFADPGEYTVTGSDVSLVHDKTLSLSGGSYTVTGSDVALTPGTKKVVMGSGEYAVTGSDITLTADRTLTLDAGSYALTGSDVTLQHTYQLALAAGSYTITGADLTLTAEKKLELGAGDYTITGSNVGLQKAIRITLDSGSYAVIGSAMGSAWPFVEVLEAGSHTITGSDVGLMLNRMLSLASGAHVQTGSTMSFGLTTSETARSAVIVYLFTLTGSADGTTDVEIPIKSLQARMRTGDPTYLQVVIPGLTEYETYVANRPNGTMEIDVAYLENGVYTLRETIISVTLDDIRTDAGPLSKSISLTGRSQRTYTNKSITLYRPIYKAVLNGATRYRFAEPHVYLFPGDSVTVDSDTFTAETVSYYVNARTGGVETRMEVAEAAA